MSCVQLFVCVCPVYQKKKKLCEIRMKPRRAATIPFVAHGAIPVCDAAK